MADTSKKSGGMRALSGKEDAGPGKLRPGAITASQPPGKNGIRGKRDKDAGKSVTGLTAFSLFRGTAPAKPDASAMCFSAFSIDILQEDSYY